MKEKDLIIQINCPFCGAIHTVEVNSGEFYEWQDGARIQEAMPHLSPTEREQLISGLCPDCQSEVFGDEDDC